MRIAEVVTFSINHVSLIACVSLLVITRKHSTRSNITKLFTVLALNMILLNIGTLLQTYERVFFERESFVFIFICYVGICFSPILVFYLGLLFRDPHRQPRPAHLLLLLFPLLSLTVISVPQLRDNYFFLNYSVYSNEAVYGAFYYIHSLYSYTLMAIGIINILYSSVKTSGFFSRQSLIISFGIIVAVTANVLYSFNILRLTFDITACAITVATMCFSVAIFKYKFLSVTPIALKKVVDIISDGFVVIDTEYRIIDYNNSIFRLFNNGIRLRINDDIRTVISNNYGRFLQRDEIVSLCESIFKTGQSVSREKHITLPNFDKYFSIELSPVFARAETNRIAGIIFLFKDITRARKDLEIIQETMAAMLEQERLATLGQMVGGFAHNLKTPIMSISGGLEAIDDLAKEYDCSIEDEEVTPEDHHEIAREIMEWIRKIRVHCAYISDIISTIKGQAVHFNASGKDRAFAIDEFIKRLELLVKYELKKRHCTLNVELRADASCEIQGEINSLVQIFDNLIQNSLDAYGGREGRIDLVILQDREWIEFSLTDYGCGISEDVKNRLFKEMITTKGKDGTGLGLYMSYATVKGHFRGNMLVESRENEGTTFRITIPYVRHGPPQKDWDNRGYMEVD